MIYNWDGDCIVHGCAIEKKRFVIGSRKAITTDIREFVSPVDDVIIKDTLKKLATKHKLPKTTNSGDFDKRAMVVWDYVARNVEYVFDRKSQGKADFWLFPSEVLTLKEGDCEDSSFLLASLLIGSGISPFNVRVALGELLDKNGNSLGGHCWVMYKNEAGTWCLLESTFDRAPWSMPAADRFTDSGEVTYLPYYVFNNYHLWAVYHDKADKTLDFESFIAARQKMHDLRDPAFASGGWLSTLTGDTSPGHVELTTEVLKSFNFSSDAISVACDAAQDPDFYEWGHPYAHAQTGSNDNDGTTNETQDKAIGNYLNWLRDLINRIYPAVADSPDHGLFFLGYALHGIQDLAAHQGVTNAQHSYESYMNPGTSGVDCDHNNDNRKRATEYTAEFLKRFAAKDPALFDRMRGYDAGTNVFFPKLAQSKKCALLGVKGWDLSLSAYRTYKG
ncbi:MAG TPA: transglutaminase-like domain-containing protein, partial [Nitrospira sp.]|nr:transglutaminase-like domain-containing protein [Nitrospira sp.]